MAQESEQPVIVVIHANTGENLPSVEKEAEVLAGIVTEVGGCEVVSLPSATLKQVVDGLINSQYRERIVIVHYAGHANGRGIFLRAEGSEREGKLAFVNGLAALLGRLPKLRLLFLNGCATREQ